MFGHYMMVRQWDPSFDPEVSLMNIIGVWIRISGLPFSIYEKIMLMVVRQMSILYHVNGNWQYLRLNSSL